MQPLLCKGGYPIPFAPPLSKHTIVAISATVNDTTAAARLTLIDSPDFAVVANGNDMQFKDRRRLIFDQKCIAYGGGVIGMIFPPEGLKVTNGISLNSLSTNLLAGKTFIYVK